MCGVVKAGIKLQARYRGMKARKEVAAKRRRAMAPDLAAAAATTFMQPMVSAHTGAESADSPEADSEPSRWEKFQEKFGKFRRHLRSFTEARTPAGLIVMSFFSVVLVLNVIATLVGTIPEVGDHPSSGLIFQVEEVFCDTMFLVEYILRIVAGGPRNRVTAPWRLFDLFTLIPGIAVLRNLALGRKIIQHSTAERVVEMVILCRIVRVLDFPVFRREVVTVCRALKSASGLLIMPGFLSFHIWLCTSAAFVWCENQYQGPFQKEMVSIPSAMYWTSHFLIGEWAQIDFSPGAGSRLCILVALFGMMTFAIPLGIIVESVQTALMLELVETTGLDELDKLDRAVTKDLEFEAEEQGVVAMASQATMKTKSSIPKRKSHRQATIQVSMRPRGPRARLRAAAALARALERMEK